MQGARRKEREKRNCFFSIGIVDECTNDVSEHRDKFL